MDWSDLLSNFECVSQLMITWPMMYQERHRLEGWKSYFDLVGGMDTDSPSAEAGS